MDSEVSRDDQNYVFREFECGFAREQNFVLKVRESTGWSKGKAIPPECKRLMRVAKGRELSNHSDWFGFVMKHDRFESPTGKLISTQGILVGSALIEIESELEIKTSTTLLKIARNLKNLMS
ncbi:regulator [Vibrio cholerae]|nr:regulator [Vibrio cholerae]